MRCEHCPYFHVANYYEDDEFCYVFGDIENVATRNQHGRYGCKYNLPALKKMHESEKVVVEKVERDYMKGYVEFMKELEAMKDDKTVTI